MSVRPSVHPSIGPSVLRSVGWSRVFSEIRKSRFLRLERLGMTNNNNNTNNDDDNSDEWAPTKRSHLMCTPRVTCFLFFFFSFFSHSNFLDATTISIRGHVRPSVCASVGPSVCPVLFLNDENRCFYGWNDFKWPTTMMIMMINECRRKGRF